MESWVNLGRKEGPTTIQILAKQKIKLETMWLEDRDFFCFWNHDNYIKGWINIWFLQSIIYTPITKGFQIEKK